MCLVACGCKAVFKASERTQHPMVTTLVKRMTPKDRLCWLGCWPKEVLGLFSHLLWLSLTFPRSVDPGAGVWVTAQTPPCSARGCQRLASSGTTLASLGIFYWAAVALPSGSAVSSRGKERLPIMASFASALGRGRRDLPKKADFEISDSCLGICVESVARDLEGDSPGSQ